MLLTRSRFAICGTEVRFGFSGRDIPPSLLSWGDASRDASGADGDSCFPVTIFNVKTTTAVVVRKGRPSPSDVTANAGATHFVPGAVGRRRVAPAAFRRPVKEARGPRCFGILWRSIRARVSSGTAASPYLLATEI